jgi:hypothetical protein
MPVKEAGISGLDISDNNDCSTARLGGRGALFLVPLLPRTCAFFARDSVFCTRDTVLVGVTATEASASFSSAILLL